MSETRSDQILIPAPAEVRFLWGLALTPVAGLIGSFLASLYLILNQHPPPHPIYPTPRPPWWEEMTALFELGLFTSLFSWPVTLVVLPFMRGRLSSRTWRAFGALTFSGFAAGFVGPIPALLMFSLIRPQNGFVWEWFFPTLGAISGLLTAMPYFLLTNPRRPPSRPATVGRDGSA